MNTISVISSRVNYLMQRDFKSVVNLPLRPMKLEKGLVINLSDCQLLSNPDNFTVLVAETINGRCVEFAFSKLANGEGEVAKILNRCATIDEFRRKMNDKLVIVSAIHEHEFTRPDGQVFTFYQYEFNFLGQE